MKLPDSDGVAIPTLSPGFESGGAQWISHQVVK